MLKLLKDATLNEQENNLYDAWLTLYPMMYIRKIDFISFSDYKEKNMKPKSKSVEKVDIFKEMIALAQSTKGAK